MKNSRGKLIRFMQMKHELINIKTGEDLGYFDYNDAFAITNWKVKDANTIWKKIQENILLYNEYALIDILCPFCLKATMDKDDLYDSDECDGCEYAKNHGVCNNWDSPNTYTIVKTELESVNEYDCPNNEDYQNILLWIDKEVV